MKDVFSEERVFFRMKDVFGMKDVFCAKFKSAGKALAKENNYPRTNKLFAVWVGIKHFSRIDADTFENDRGKISLPYTQTSFI